MVESEQKEIKQTTTKEKENIIVTIFKQLLGINFHKYGTKGEILK